MNNFVNTACIETSRFLVLLHDAAKLNGLIKITYSLCVSEKKSFDNSNINNNRHGDYFSTMSLRINKKCMVCCEAS
jgi:hypothetical protein